mgnify:CR=1 FL=1
MGFYERVWDKIREIPKGKVSTYKEVALALNSKAYRAVGTALKLNPYAPKVPCHRVINLDGHVGNYSGSGGMKKKIEMLRKEGVEIKNNKIDYNYLHNFA